MIYNSGARAKEQRANHIHNYIQTYITEIEKRKEGRREITKKTEGRETERRQRKKKR